MLTRPDEPGARGARVARGDIADVSAAELRVAPPSSAHRLQCWALRWAASLRLPSRWFQTQPRVELRARSGRLTLEIVSHCWNYSQLLEYQLGSLVAQPPREIDVTVTVYFCREDRRTLELLELASTYAIEGLRWQWRAVAKEHLFRRAIGRNHAALSSRADWIWFTDCDLLFGAGCLDALGRALQGCVQPLVFPRQERLTRLLDDETLATHSPPRLRAAPEGLDFTSATRRKAQGPLQIAHGDWARAAGYCRDLACYQRAEDRWRKTREDSAFRWLAGTDGEALDVPAVSRLRHATKGRYHGSAAQSKARLSLRKLQQLWRGAGG